MPDLAALSLQPALIGFAAVALVIVTVGTRLTALADRIADRTGFGEALIGSVLLGAVTSLSGTVTSVSAAAAGASDLAISNAIGGIAVQTAFLAVADLVYRRVNLEHGAAEITHLSQGALLICLLAIPIVATTGPDGTVFGVSPYSVALVIGYIMGVRLSDEMRRRPMWVAKKTAETADDQEPELEADTSLTRLMGEFLILAVFAFGSGWALAGLGQAIAEESGLGGTVVGTLMTAVTTSLPELITSIVAVRRGALNLAVGGIIGGNAFDVLFLSLSDVAYRDGSIYQAMTDTHVLMLASSAVMTGVLLLGLLARQRGGTVRIGFESTLVLAAYGLVVWAVATGG